MITIDDALWLRSLGVADADIKARMTDTDTQTEPTEQKTEKTEQKTEKTEQKTEQTEQKTEQTEQKQTGQQKTETKPDNTTAVLMEVIKTLQAQNAKLATGQGAGSDDKIEDMLLSLI